MEAYKSFAVTVQGGSHIKSGMVCQDASDFYDDETMSIAVVADGHGDPSCFRSDVGSKLAVQCAIEGISGRRDGKQVAKGFVKEHEDLFKQSSPPSQKELKKLIREKLIKQVVASWNMRVMEHYQKNAFKEEELKNVGGKYQQRYEKGEKFNHAYGTSLIAAAITPWYWFGFHIGDGRFTVLYQDSSGDQPVPWDPKCYLNVTTSICDDDILDREEEGVRAFVSLHKDKTPPIGIFLCSDGVDDNYPADEEENAKRLYKLYRNVALTFVEDGHDSTCGADGRSGQIKDLANGFATKGKGDDTSLAGILDLEKMKKAAPEWNEKIKKMQEAEKLEAARIAAEEEKQRAEAEAKEKAKDEVRAARAAAAAKATADQEAEKKAAMQEVAKKAAEQAAAAAKPPTPAPVAKPAPADPGVPPAAKPAPADPAKTADEKKQQKIDVATKLIDLKGNVEGEASTSKPAGDAKNPYQQQPDTGTGVDITG